MTERVDLLVVGGGLFGAHAALYFAAQGRRVMLVEREGRSSRWAKASLVNQARMHSGHHYPRSIRTALMAHEHRERFEREHRDIINGQFTAYYGIEKYGSLTDAQQFVRFCRKVGIKCNLTERSDLFTSSRIEALFEVDEKTFDPFLLRQKYDTALRTSGVELAYGSTIYEAAAMGDKWVVQLRGPNGEPGQVEASSVINATYAAINTINSLFGMPAIPASHELSEMVLVYCPSLAGVGLTVIDGPYLSIMPYGSSGLHSLSSVLYTHRAFSSDWMPRFPCQDHRTDCVPAAVAVCSRCPSKPSTNARKMLKQLAHYVNDTRGICVHGSLHTVKTKLKSYFASDGRPTEIHVHCRRPYFASVFSGKVNSIYEVEKIEI